MALPAASLETRKASSLATVTKIALTIEYEGTRYYGFQLQAELPTIQGELEAALWRLTGENVRVMAASRTDTGVHAEGQVVSFRTTSSLPEKTFVQGLNYYLPGDIAVKTAARISDSFDVRRDAVSREYDYYILNIPARSPMKRNFSYLITELLEVGAMSQACRVLIGRHDFASFAACEEAGIKSTVREVFRAGIEKKGDLIIFNIMADSFLRHQVRNTVGALIRVGQGRVTVDEFSDMLEARTLGLAGPRAPGRGLCLMRINYPVTLWEEHGEIHDENI
jgi:tRNA pseudouridine38-40 synthase